MGGNPGQGRAAAKTNQKKYGKDFYKKIGAMGGRKSRSSWLTSEKAREIGRRGGSRSRRAWTEEERERHSEAMRRAIARRRGTSSA